MNACFAAPNALAVALAALIIIPQLSAISVWINEFHYDNNGGDVGEFVEIAGVAGTDLSLYSNALQWKQWRELWKHLSFRLSA